MAEYIEKEGVKKSINFLFDIRLNVAPEIKQSVLDLIDGERAVDVQPVKRGHWIETDYGMFYECSECGNVQEFERNFCYECGADMRGDTNG